MIPTNDLETTKKEIRDLCNIFKDKKTTQPAYNQKNLVKWINKSGFGTSDISNMKNFIFHGKGNMESAKIKKWLAYMQDYKKHIESNEKSDLETKEIQSNKKEKKEVKQPKSNSKLDRYNNKKYYLYFFETRKAEHKNYIGRAVLSIIGDSVSIKDIDPYPSYTGEIKIVKEDNTHLVLRLKIKGDFKEKNLKIIFRITKGDPAPFMIGGYMNIDKYDSIVMGTILAELYTGDQEPTVETIEAGSETYKNLNKYVRKFFHSKDKNFIKTRSKGFFTNDDFVEFFEYQKTKQVINSTTGEEKIFIAYPVRSNESEFVATNKTVSLVAKELGEIFLCKVDFAGTQINVDTGKLPRANTAFKSSIKKMKYYDKFIMIYPDKVASSCLIELGFALMLKKSCTVCYKNLEDLPTLIQETEIIKKVRYKDDVDLLEQITDLGKDVFR
jgi:hypothetical protein